MSGEQADKQAVAQEPLVTFLHISVLNFLTLHSNQYFRMNYANKPPRCIKHMNRILKHSMVRPQHPTGTKMTLKFLTMLV